MFHKMLTTIYRTFAPSYDASDALVYMNWYIKIRWLFLMSIAIPGVLSQLIPQGINEVVLRDIKMASAVIATNGLFFLCAKFVRRDKTAKRLALLITAIDIITITTLIFIKGGVESRSPILYAIPILLSSVVFGHKGLVRATLASILAYNSLIILDGLNIIHSIGAVNPTLRLDQNYIINTVIFFSSALGIIGLLVDIIINLMTEARKKAEIQARVQRNTALQLEQQAIYLAKTKTATINILEDLQTERDSLEELNATNEALLTSIVDGLVATDKSGRVTYINDSAIRMLGYKRAEVIGKKWAIEVPSAMNEKGEKLAASELPTYIALKTGRSVSRSLQDVYFYVAKKGTKIPVLITASPIVKNGKIEGSLVLFRDVTHEKEIDTAKDEFVSIASHQLRTPATGVKQAIGLLVEGYLGKFTKQQDKVLRQALESNERELRLIEDLLSIATVDAGKMILHKSSVDIGEIVKTAANNQSSVIKLRKQKLTITSPKKQIKLVADPERLLMVVENLVSNASKYTPDGGSITIDWSETAASTNITVADTGIGIAKDQMSKLFQKFTRIDSQLARDRGGSGVGLYLCQHIIKLHGGEIIVRSTPGKGSKFIIQLPTKGK